VGRPDGASERGFGPVRYARANVEHGVRKPRSGDVFCVMGRDADLD
jgi:hypothetical protein